ncbi:MAG: hypothetical protein KGL69_03840 [Alphaproteobacteria bacterium]|jgi:hypothetical protein|nr:hypothetical protein [Alphaproteobacteria bacterium]
MSRTWTSSGPIALPARGVVGVAAWALGLAAIAGLALGWSAAYRPELGGPVAAGMGPTDAPGTLAAQPLVDLTPEQAARPAAADAAASGGADQAKADDLAAQTAKAQALQAKPGGQGDIDQILASPTEKPPAPAKGGPTEAPPPKTDVPF